MATTWSKPEDVFSIALTERMRAQADEIKERINLRVKVTVKGDAGGVWVVDCTIPGGQVRQGDGEADCALSLSEEELLGMANGTLEPAYWDQEELDSTGFPAQIIRLASLLYPLD